MHPRIPDLMAALAIPLFANCTVNDPEDGAPPEGSQPVASVRAARGDASSAHLIARALALSMQSENARQVVRDLMRASEITQHKLVLQDFVTTERGARVLEHAATAAKVTTSQLRAALEKVPRLDFYVPGREHRLKWQATADIMVAVTLSEVNPTIAAYTAQGSAVTLVPRNGSPKATLFLLQPEETKSPRFNPQRRAPGSVIQDTDDGEVSGLMSVTAVLGSADRSNGALRRDGVGEDQMACPDGCGGGGGGGGGGTGGGGVPSASVGTTYIDKIETIGVCDNDLCHLGDTNEFEFKARWTYGSLVETHTLRVEGVPATGVLTGLRARNKWLLNRKPVPGLPIKVVDIRETDTIGDDLWFWSFDLNYSNNRTFWEFRDLPDVFAAPQMVAQFVW